MKHSAVKFGMPVVFNGGEGQEHQLAFITKVHSEDTVDLLVFDSNGQGTVKTSAVRRSPEDYGPEGGGYTWYYRD